MNIIYYVFRLRSAIFRESARTKEHMSTTVQVLTSPHWHHQNIEMLKV